MSYKNSSLKKKKTEVKVKQSHYMPGDVLRLPDFKEIGT
jgi:hypothetical protein